MLGCGTGQGKHWVLPGMLFSSKWEGAKDFCGTVGSPTMAGQGAGGWSDRDQGHLPKTHVCCGPKMSKAVLMADPGKTSRVIESFILPHEERSAQMSWILIVLRFMSFLKLHTKNPALVPKKAPVFPMALHHAKAPLLCHLLSQLSPQNIPVRKTSASSPSQDLIRVMHLVPIRGCLPWFLAVREGA